MQKIYETERLTLKVLGSASAELVLDYCLRNKPFLDEWEPLKPAGFYNEQFQAAQLEKELISMDNGMMFKYWIFKKGDNSRVIGAVSFNNIVRGAFQSCHLGYRLDEQEINKGYMTEAAARGISVLFDEWKLHRIEANIMPRNKRSMRVVEKLGFYNEGLAKEYLKINGKWEDHIHMVLLNDKV